MLKAFGITALLCLGERLLERAVFPGLHKAPGRIAAADPLRVDDVSTLVAEAIGLLALVCLVNGIFYVIGILARRPHTPGRMILMSVVILAMTFFGSYVQFLALPPR